VAVSKDGLQYRFVIPGTRIESRPAVGAYVSARGCGLPDIWKGTVPRMRVCAMKSAVLQKRCEPLGSAIGK
jgi:hypothetical protein